MENYLVLEEKEIPAIAHALHRHTVLINEAGEQVIVRTVYNGFARNHGYTRATTERHKILGDSASIPLYSNANASTHHEEMIRRLQDGELLSPSEASNVFYAVSVGRGTAIHLSNGPGRRAMCSQFRNQGTHWIQDATEITCKSCLKIWDWMVLHKSAALYKRLVDGLPETKNAP